MDSAFKGVSQGYVCLSSIQAREKPSQTQAGARSPSSQSLRTSLAQPRDRRGDVTLTESGHPCISLLL